MTTETKRYRCDTETEVVIRAGDDILDRQTMPLYLVGAHHAVQSVVRGGAFGQANWHDNEGALLDRAPTMTVTPDPAGELTGDDPCTCTRHEEPL